MAGDGSSGSIENAAALEKTNRDAKDNWVKAADGAAERAAAVATVTESLGLAPAAPVAPAAPAPTPPVVPPVAPPAAAAPVAPPATAAQVQEFIEALLDEAGKDVLKIPANARIPMPVNGKIEYVTAGELRKRGMLEADYTAGKQELSDNRRELEEHAARLIADRARMEAREKWIADERERLKEAQKTPEAWDRYQKHLQLLADDPDYAKTFDDALAGRERQAEDVALAASRHTEEVGEGIAQAAQWMLELAAEQAFTHVDLDRVREIYARQLEEGRATLDRSHIERIFRAEADQAQRAVGPLQQQLADLTTKFEALQSQTVAATAHNRQTQHAIDRAAAVPVTTGLPAAPAPTDRKVKPFTPRELPEVNREWSNRRD